MFRSIVAIAALLACSGAWSQEVRLICEGEVAKKNKGAGGSYSQRVSHELRFDESAGTLRFADKDGDWWEGIKLSFSESEITGRLKPGWIRSTKFRVDRYSGILYVSGETLKCRPVKSRAF